MTDEPCIGRSIWQQTRRKHPELRTAQQRAAADRFLRSQLARIEDPGLRQHAADIIRELRGDYLRWQRTPEIHERLASIEHRLTNIEAALAGHTKGREITSIRREGRS